MGTELFEEIEPATLEIGKIHQGVPYRHYHDSPGIRAGYLKLMKKSPAHLMAALQDQKEDTEALRFGRLFHLVVENGPKFLETYIIEPIFSGKTKDGKESTRSAEAKEKKAEWYAALSPDATVITEEDHSTLVGMLNAVADHSLLKKMLEGSIRECSGWVKDPETGLLLKFRPDIITRTGWILDFKTTRDASKGSFYNQIFKDSFSNPFYILGAAHYVHCGKLMGLDRSDTFTFVPIEKTRPFGIGVFPMDSGCLDIGEAWRRNLMLKYAECAASNKWPCYEEKAQMMEPPEFAEYPEWIEKEKSV